LEVGVQLSLSGAHKRFADVLIFENATCELFPFERVGLLGRNGSGKTTLLKILAGLEQPDSGQVFRLGRVAYLAQRQTLGAGRLVDVVLPETVLRLKTQLETAQHRLENPTPENLAHYTELEEAFRVAGGYDLEQRAFEVLSGLGLDGQRSSLALSGGEERRALLARLLLTPADFYLLDEPTNHLDLQSLAWLEDWILEQEAGFLIVSHDREFLDNTVQRCYELERQTLTSFDGNFTEAMALKAAMQQNQLEAYLAQQRKLKQLQLERQAAMAQASRSENKNRMGNRDATTASHLMNRASDKQGRRALALEKRIERTEELEKPFKDFFLTKIRLGDIPTGASEVLRLENVTVQRGQNILFENLNLFIRRGERVALVGANGSGKSSLLKTILGQLEVSAGQVIFGQGVSVYWAAQNTEELEAYDTLESALLGANPNLKTPEIFALLASLGLPKEPSRAVNTLSGGQRTRLSLARLSVTRASLLVLDEPTNNLDTDAIQALEKMLLEYTGTVLFASHDRRLLANIATRQISCDNLEP
jgi:ATPase subunit of ABC transporter with duplicated ATPase domains